MTSISKNVYVIKLDDIVNKYNNTYHRTTTMKPVDIKSSTYIDFNNENNKESPSDHARISKYKIIFAKPYLPNSSEEDFLIKKVKISVPWTYVIININSKGFVGVFYRRESQKTKQKEVKVNKGNKGNKQKIKAIKYVLNGKTTLVVLIVRLIKKTKYK